jgi:uncharacterized protein DUF4349
MSQRDVLAELQAGRVTAPPELRERIRLVAAADTTPRRRFTWRRAFVVAVPVAAAIAAAVVVTRPASHPAAERQLVRQGAATDSGLPFSAKSAPLAVPSAKGRVQISTTTLALQLPTAAEVSDAIKRAVAIAGSLSGYAASVHAQTHGDVATATLTLKIPRTNVQRALTRLSALGTITSEQVSVTDKQAGLNATDREIARLRKQLAAAAPGSPQAKALTAHIQRLQRAEAATRRNAHFATIHLALRTPPGKAPAKHGELYGLALGLGAALVAALAWLAVRIVRRRREDALLSGR